MTVAAYGFFASGSSTFVAASNVTLSKRSPARRLGWSGETSSKPFERARLRETWAGASGDHETPCTARSAPTTSIPLPSIRPARRPDPCSAGTSAHLGAMHTCRTSRSSDTSSSLSRTGG